MSTIAAREAREEFADLLNRAAYAHERVIITRNGRPVAALISTADLELLEALEDAADRAAMREGREADDGERIPWEQVKARHGL
jgi:prevent-host-death family protein